MLRANAGLERRANGGVEGREGGSAVHDYGVWDKLTVRACGDSWRGEKKREGRGEEERRGGEEEDEEEEQERLHNGGRR